MVDIPEQKIHVERHLVGIVVQKDSGSFANARVSLLFLARWQCERIYHFLTYLD